MKVTAIRLVNFAAFEDTGWIELRPITLLFGRNSSGKSAIIRALLLLKQSLDAKGEERPLAFVKENGLVDLGDFQTTVHRKPGEGPGESQQKDYLERSIVFGFRCDLTGDPILDRVRRLSGKSQEDQERLSSVELLIGFGWYDKSVRANLLELRAVDLKATVPPVVLLECKLLGESDVAGLDVQSGFILNSDVAQDAGLDEQTFGLHLRSERGFWTSFANPMPQSFKALDDILSAVQDGVASFLQKIVHIGPIRPLPERTYIIRDTDQPRFEREGLKGWYTFLRDRLGQTDQAVLIADWMRRLGLADGVRVIADKDNRPVTRSQVSVDDKVEGVNIKDIGFGASQVLPVIVAAVLTEPDSLVIVEQPELHLHPRAQAELADLFIEIVSRGPRSSAPAFLIETHSENLLLRFRVRLAQTTAYEDQELKLRQEDFGAIFVERGDLKASVEAIEFDELGAYVQQPKGFVEFFGDDFNELQALRRARTDAATKQNEE